MIGQNARHVCHFFFQWLAAIFFIGSVLFFLDQASDSQIIWAVGASTLASSAFLVFFIPKSAASEPIKIIGSYVIAMLSGECMRLVIKLIYKTAIIREPMPFQFFEIMVAISVGIALLLMVLLDSAHPPAAGLAVVTVLNIRNIHTLTVILIAALALAGIRYVFRKYLRNLV